MRMCDEVEAQATPSSKKCHPNNAISAPSAKKRLWRAERYIQPISKKGNRKSPYAQLGSRRDTVMNVNLMQEKQQLA